jgi:ribosomal protein L29
MNEQKIDELKERLANLKNELTEMSKDKNEITEERILNVLEQLNSNINNISITEINNNVN